MFFNVTEVFSDQDQNISGLFKNVDYCCVIIINILTFTGRNGKSRKVMIS